MHLITTVRRLLLPLHIQYPPTLLGALQGVLILPSVVVGSWASGSAFVSGVGSQVLPPRPFSPCRPDPEGVDAPPTFMGGMGVPHFFGRSSHSHGLYPPWPSSASGFSTSSTAVHYRQINFPDPIPEGLLTVVFGGDHHHPAPPPPGGILMCLHLWRLRLRSLLRRCVLCLIRISFLLRRRALPCPLCRPAFPPWWFRWIPLHLLLVSQLLPQLLVSRLQLQLLLLLPLLHQRFLLLLPLLGGALL